MDQVLRSNTLMNKQIGDLSVTKVQLEHKIKKYQKQKESLKTSQTSRSNQFIDDYEREHLVINNGAEVVKKRPTLSRKKRIKLTSG